MWSCQWVSCETEEKGLKMSKIKSAEDNDLLSEYNNNPQLSTTFEWLDGNESDSLMVPLGNDEEFCSADEEIIVESDNDEDVVHLELDDEENIAWTTELEDADNGRKLPLFISHILCCEQYEKCFKLGSLVFQKVEIFGTVVATQITNRKNNLLVDDGTAQILCYMDDSVNDFETYEDSCHEDFNVDSIYYDFNQFYKKKMKEWEYTLPTFDKINVGDRVFIDGKVSLYKDNFYLFIRRLNRPEGNNSYINFVNNIFKLYETYDYDFGVVNTLKSHYN